MFNQLVMGYSNITKKVKLDVAVTLIQATDHLNIDIDFDDDNEIILSKINQATSIVEDYTNRDIIYTSNEKTYIGFNTKTLYVEEAPYKSIESLTATVDDVDTILVEGVDFDVQIKHTEFIVHFNEAVIADKVVIKFYTGDNFDDVNKSLQAAILIIMNDLYDIDRTSATIGVNYHVSEKIGNILAGHTIIRW